jgi:hypothetical protein
METYVFEYKKVKNAKWCCICHIHSEGVNKTLKYVANTKKNAKIGILSGIMKYTVNSSASSSPSSSSSSSALHRSKIPYNPKNNKPKNNKQKTKSIASLSDEDENYGKREVDDTVLKQRTPEEERKLHRKLDKELEEYNKKRDMILCQDQSLMFNMSNRFNRFEGWYQQDNEYIMAQKVKDRIERFANTTSSNTASPNTKSSNTTSSNTKSPNNKKKAESSSDDTDSSYYSTDSYSTDEDFSIF